MDLPIQAQGKALSSILKELTNILSFIYTQNRSQNKKEQEDSADVT